MIYLDNAATTYPKPESVYRAMDFGMRNLSFNAGRGTYEAAREACRVIDKTRVLMAELAGCRPDHVVFSSSATEAMNQIVLGLNLEHGDIVYISPFEHNAIVRPLQRLITTVGIDLRLIPFKMDDWSIDVQAFKSELTVCQVKAVFVSQVSNVTGLMLPYQIIFDLARRSGAVTILDASQSFGILDADLSLVDFVVFAGHKSLYGPFGVGGFISTGNIVLDAVKAGGTGSDSLNPDMPDVMPGRYEAGSPNVVAINGLAAALEWRKMVDIRKVEDELCRYLIAKLRGLSSVSLFLPEGRVDDVFSIVSFSVAGYKASEIGEILEESFGISLRTGYHCAPFVHDLIQSRGFYGTIRASIGFFNVADDVDALVDALGQIG